MTAPKAVPVEKPESSTAMKTKLREADEALTREVTQHHQTRAALAWTAGWISAQAGADAVPPWVGAIVEQDTAPPPMFEGGA